MTVRAPTLVLAVGNPSRGDDALGALFAEAAAIRWQSPIARGEVEVLTDFQLQVEHACDLVGRRRVLFVDADAAITSPCELRSVTPTRPGPLSHALGPGEVLAALADLGGAAPEEVVVLAIRGERFELGEPLSDAARRSLEAALALASDHLGWASSEAPRDEPIGLRLTVDGVVQGVGFRPWVARTARSLGLAGQVRNGGDGVVIEVFGPHSSINAFLHALDHDTPPAARVRNVIRTPLPATPRPETFTIEDSRDTAERRLSIPPDLALCPACRAELHDPGARYFGYPFTACTACGPRFSVVMDLPYDRERTALSSFPICHECDTEYATESDRRYHAQTIACPRCGPRLTLRDARGEPVPTDDPLRTTAELLRAGQVVALQGLGGFHLACDATSDAAVTYLRDRKRRADKPFAVMVTDLAEAEAIAHLTPESRAALTSSEAPITLVPLSAPHGLSHEVTRGLSRIGLFLPYTPLHELLLTRVGRPLVMTSGNLSGEPIALTLEDARSALSGVTDAYLTHDRPMVRRVEDSVVSFDASLPGPRVLRRARGLAPTPIPLGLTSPEPVLALGGHLKNTACLIVADEAWLMPHLGDLETFAAEEAFARDVDRFESLLGVRCEVLVHDLHPDYATTRYAQTRPARIRLGVQHHHAHVLAVLAERRWRDPVLALALDGTGYGLDQTAWGGEVLHVDGLTFERPTALRPIPLVGGERALREVWRIAVGALVDSFGPEAPALLTRLAPWPGVDPQKLARVAALALSGPVTRVRGLGRVFDAVGALVLGRAEATFEGQVPMLLEDLASEQLPPYPFVIPTARGTATLLADHQEIDLRPMFREVVADLLSHRPARHIASRLHRTIALAFARTIDSLDLAHGAGRIVLTGGALQNRRLERELRDTFGARHLLAAHEVPVNDGGLALGQALAGVLNLVRGG